MKRYRKLPGIAVILFIFHLFPENHSMAQVISYRGSWGPQGIAVEMQDASEVRMNFSVTEFSLEDYQAGDQTMKQVNLPGHFMHNQAGAPDLPGRSYFIALPEGATASFNLSEIRTDTINGIDIMPAPVIPIDDDQESLVYEKDPTIYLVDQFYPEAPVMMAEMTEIRGVQVAVLGITPFRYNPVKKQLIVYRDMKVGVGFSGGNGVFGKEKYRSRYWDPVLYDYLLNHESLPKVTYNRHGINSGRTDTGCEYLIITPDGTVFQQWADSIKKFRTEQGILTDVVTITEVGGNTAAAIEAYINNAYNNWDIPPDACLLLADYGSDPSNSITSNVLNDHPGGYNPYISDNLFADVTGGDLLPEVAFARITARNATELELMVTKFLNYERNPPTDSGFYDNPVTALGWQTERWFQICSETVGGYFKNEQGKNPVRINEIYDGNPDVDPWSTAPNTTTVLNYFGPSGLGYIPASPSTLGGWTGGTATMINNAINNGTFILQHRDHGYIYGWGEPAYSTSYVSSLTNTDLTLVMSINCQTGKFDNATDCLAEKFHRHSYSGQGSGALGVIAPTEISYSFVNDSYTWGFYDNLWPDFMPSFTSNPIPRGLLPCFGNAAGKYHLQQSTWPPVSQSIKTITYKLFHFHGDAFTTLYSEIPQALTVTHDSILLTGMTSFSVTADSGAFIALVIDNDIQGTAVATGDPVAIPIPGTQLPGEQMIVTVTLTNYYRYRNIVDIQPADGPFVLINGDPIVNDSAWNNNGQADYGEEVFLSLPMINMGNETASGVQVTISSGDPYITINDSTESYGNITPGAIITISNGFHVEISDSVPDEYLIPCMVSVTSDTTEWISSFDLEAHTPTLNRISTDIEELSGDLDGIFEPGETGGFNISVCNTGSGPADSVYISMNCSDTLITVSCPPIFYGLFTPGDTVTQTFTVTASAATPAATFFEFSLLMLDDIGMETNDSFDIMIGRLPALVLDLDPNTSSGPSVQSAITTNGVDADYSTTFPADLDIYSSIFVCLGIYPNNHVLSTSEGQLLADYLNSSGNLYMEGGDTWAWDPVTAVHPLFQIQGTSDGGADLATISGASGTYASGLSYAYTGEESYIDRLGVLSTAFVTLNNSSPAYATCISYESGTYRTIGSSHEFAGLSNGTYNRNQLMRAYLGFFRIPAQAEWLGLTSDWHNPANWSNGMVPDQNTVATIPAGGNYPAQFSGGTATCKGIIVEAGVNLVLPTGSTLIIDQ